MESKQFEYVGWAAIFSRTGFNRSRTIIAAGIPIKRISARVPVLLESDYQAYLQARPLYRNTKTPKKVPTGHNSAASGTLSAV